VAPWSGVRKMLLKRFRNDNSEQQRNTVSYLQALSSDKAFRRDAEDIERYLYSFQGISNNLVAEKRLTAYDQMVCFLQGLPEKISVKIFQDLRLDIDDPRSFTENGGFTRAVTLALTSNRMEASVNRLREVGILTDNTKCEHRRPGVRASNVESSTETTTSPQTQEMTFRPTILQRTPATHLDRQQSGGGPDAKAGETKVMDRICELEKEMEKMRLFQQSAMVPNNVRTYGGQ